MNTTTRSFEILRTAAQNTNDSRSEVAFVFDDVTDWQTLAAGLRSDVTVVRIDSASDGLAQMAEYLRGQTGIDAIHVLSHGAAGSLQLGTTTLSASNLTDSASLLADIEAALASDGDILLYGCSVGADRGFITQIATLTQADVAASTDLTGAISRGGNWLLEALEGNLESGLAVGLY